ncbi:hypothetical protein LTR86_002594 [Recurvomyces mirabilis]|nr:hypothetical protein LTR86_002594 [Recurvomyces mirabilis]
MAAAVQLQNSKTMNGTRYELPQTGLAALLGQLALPGEVQLPGEAVVRVGKDDGQPVYKVVFRTQRALQTPMTEMGVGNAFVANEIDVEGDLSVLFGLRSHLYEKVPFIQKLQFVWDSIKPATQMNSKAIGEHYHRGDDFYHTFIDKRYRFYSHGIFHSPTESIEEASEHKLETIWKALGLKEGMKLLDVGGGWGGVTQYCGARGVHVSTLTIAPDGAKYIERLLEDQALPGEVYLEDFLLHQPVEQYDHVVILGVIEHLPDYRRFAKAMWDVLKPGGRMYLDGSAAVQKFAVSAFTRKYIWTGTHTFMTAQDVITELLYHGFEIVELVRETRDYEWTMRQWAQRLEAAQEDITARWGEETYRLFRLYLWGGAHAFKTNSLQAYHLLAEKTASSGPRPPTMQRVWQSARDLW